MCISPQRVQTAAARYPDTFCGAATSRTGFRSRVDDLALQKKSPCAVRSPMPPSSIHPCKAVYIQLEDVVYFNRPWGKCDHAYAARSRTRSCVVNQPPSCRRLSSTTSTRTASIFSPSEPSWVRPRSSSRSSRKKNDEKFRVSQTLFSRGVSCWRDDVVERSRGAPPVQAKSKSSPALATRWCALFCAMPSSALLQGNLCSSSI